MKYIAEKYTDQKIKFAVISVPEYFTDTLR
jgi:molecular chaperone DnaK (HSP70)